MQKKKYNDIACLNQDPISVDNFATLNPLFVCVISYSETSMIPGITVAGATPDLLKYTSAADSEFLYYGRCKCINNIPATPDGKPSPAIITKAALELADIPFLIVDAGTKVKPSIPHFSFGLRPGNNILYRRALSLGNVRKAYSYGILLGRVLARLGDVIVIGESIPGGTTSCLGVLSALGIDAKFKVSSSMPDNPHILKNKVVAKAMKKANISFGELEEHPLEAISLFGDPMLPSVAGLVVGVNDFGGKVILAGGTQMAGVIAVIKSLKQSLDKVCIATTTYVAEDHSSNLADLVGLVSTEVPVFAADLHLIRSCKSGLKAFARGYVKDGVGAGGVSFASMLKTRGKISGSTLLNAIELEYDRAIQQIRPNV